MKSHTSTKKTGDAWKWNPWDTIRDKPNMVEKVNNRLIGLPELVLDLDPRKDETKDLFDMRVQHTIDNLKEDHAEVMNVFKTGSKGVHVHVLIRDMHGKNRSYRQIQRIKRVLLNRYLADTQKATTRCMIAIEGCPHWKTGQPKEVMKL